MNLQIDGKVAIVVGASAGMGFAIAKALAAERVKVMLVARGQAALQQATQHIRSVGGDAAFVCADMSQREQVLHAVAETTRIFGAPDIAIANVSPTNEYGFDGTTDEHYYRVYDELVMSVVHLARAVLPGMIERRWGRIVNIGSVCMKEPHRWYNLYLSNTGRAAVVGLNRTLSNEFAEYGITVNTIAPGLIDTGRQQRVQTTAAADLIEPMPRIPMGRPGSVDEIASTCAFLCSHPAGYITGQTLAVDGGWTRGLL